MITILILGGFVGETFASGIDARSDSRSRSKTPLRVAFNAGGLRQSVDARLRAEPPALNDVMEVEALHKAADSGNAQAQLNLGFCYESGHGVAKDPAQAIAWFRRAAAQDFDEAEYTLGCCYNGDDGFPKDQVEAVRWWAKAAAHGHADAQYCLGLSYAMGEGVDKNPGEAAKWWMKAAEQNHANAQYFLGLSYSAGLGVPKIPEQAVYWLRKAATNGNENAVVVLKKLGQASDIPTQKPSDEHDRQIGSNRTG